MMYWPLILYGMIATCMIKIVNQAGISFSIFFLTQSEWSDRMMSDNEFKVIRADETIFWWLKACHLKVTKTLLHDF
jgi:hypothetical protein